MIRPIGGLHRSFTDEEVAAYNELHVIPFPNLEYQEECITEAVMVSGQLVDGVTCHRTRITPMHPYEELPLDELEELAYNDQLAAAYLGQRTEDRNERLIWMLRASAISGGKPGPIILVAEKLHRAKTLWVTRNGKGVEEPQVKSMIVRIALEKVAETLGDPRANVERWQAALSEITSDDRDSFLHDADHLADEYLEYMIYLEREIMGTTTIQEKKDV